MATKGSNKELSVRQEDHIAYLFDGRRSPSSGASVTNKGDVTTERLKIECKMTKASKPTMVKQFEKIAQEAWEHGKDPMLALRYYDPSSPIADRDGWIDLTVRLAVDDAVREIRYT